MKVQEGKEEYMLPRKEKGPLKFSKKLFIDMFKNGGAYREEMEKI